MSNPAQIPQAKKRVLQQAVLDGNGAVVVPGDWNPKFLSAFFRDDDLRGKRVLDMGSNTGGLSLELARRGALVHAAEPVKPNSAAQEVAKAEKLTMEWSATDLFSSHTLGRFDTIVCFGLIYHFRHPQYVLDYLSSLEAPVLYLSSQTMPGEKLLMRNRNENRKEHSRHGGVRGYEPTHHLLRSMMRASGFGSISNEEQ